MEDVNWTGVWIPDGLQLVSIAPEAKAVMQHCYGGYTTNLTLEEFIRPENYLVHTLEGQPLPVGPVRTLIPHPYAWSFPPKISWAFGGATATTWAVNPGPKNATAIYRGSEILRSFSRDPSKFFAAICRFGRKLKRAPWLPLLRTPEVPVSLDLKESLNSKAQKIKIHWTPFRLRKH